MEYHFLPSGILFLKEGSKTLYLSPLTHHVFRFSQALEADPAVYSPVLSREVIPSEPSIKEEDGGLEIRYPELRLIVKEGLLFTGYDAKGKLLFEQLSFPEAQAKEGLALENDHFPLAASFRLLDQEHFYGLGDHPGPLDRRNYRYVNWNTDFVYAHVEVVKSLYKSFPFFLSKRQGTYFGFFFDNPRKTLFDFGVDCSRYFFAAKGGAFDGYLFLGSSPKEILASFTSLTGRFPLPPRWSLGNQQCRWSYRNEKEVQAIADGFEKNEIPLDAIYLDIDYMDGFRIFTWNHGSFPQLSTLADSLKAKGIRMVAILDPGIKVDPAYSVYADGLKNDCFAKLEGKTYVNQVWPGDAVYPCFNEKQVRSWWSQHVVDFIQATHLSGLWCDMDEPASFKGEIPDQVDFGTSKHQDIHNVYGHFMAEATFEGLQKVSGERPFVITRAAYVGTSRFSTVWTGDNQSIWDHLRLALPQQMSLGLSGMPFVGTDIGGFCGDTTPELLTRWIEVGLFSPLMRNHCPYYNRAQEPWTFTPECLEAYRKAVNLRYEFVPYLYDLFYQHQETGLPILRPLFLLDSADERFANENSEFGFGDQLLVAPILESGASSRVVNFPRGKWYSFFDFSPVKEKEKLERCPLDQALIYAKEGSIIPLDLTHPMNLAEPLDELTLRVFPGEGRYIHYQDNGKDYAYQKGEYNLYLFATSNGKVTYRMLHEGLPTYSHIYVETAKGKKALK
jgi:alpha-glucosidase